MIPGNTFQYEGKTWTVTATGTWGVRGERNDHEGHSIIVLPWDYLT